MPGLRDSSYALSQFEEGYVAKHPDLATDTSGPGDGLGLADHAHYCEGCRRRPPPALRWAASYVLNRAEEEVPAALHLRAFDENGKRLLGVALRRRDEGE
jgi:hypothetical protein